MSSTDLRTAATTPLCTALPQAPLEAIEADVVVVPMIDQKGATHPAPLGATAHADELGALATLMALSRSSATALMPSAAIGRWAAPRLLLVRVQARPDETGFVAAMRSAVAAAVRAAVPSSVERVALPFTVPGRSPDPLLARAIVEAAVLAAYDFDRYRSPEGAVAQLLFPGLARDDVRIGRIVGAATNLARDLVNLPGADMTPADLAERCVQECTARGVPVRVLDEGELVEGGFGGIAGVGRASVNPPRLVVIGEPAHPDRATALVGKGITFDTGGLSMKGFEPMLTMKCDMAGAAAVLGAVVAAAELGVADDLVGYLACAENSVSGEAYRPSDVLRHRNGITSEVVSTDAEGRLVLADALAYAVESHPARIVDVATLTGATGLGPELWGVLGTDSALVADLLRAGEAAGEPGWALPVWDGYRPSLHSDVADLKNYDVDAVWGHGAILGALYLREFVGDIPWAHLDTAATAFRAKGTPQWAPGATGSPVRTLVHWLLASAWGP